MQKKATGRIYKMRVDNLSTVEYKFIFENINNNEELEFSVNDLLGKKIKLEYTGTINCISCNRKTNKSFSQGYCFPCFRAKASCDTCIIKPELCHFHKDTCREPGWGLKNCFIPHVVYLANTSGLKIGITRESQIPTRWIDQGAIKALPIIKVQSRRQSGLIEVKIAKFIDDKTNWRKMLKNDVQDLDLEAERDKLLPQLTEIIKDISSKFDFKDIEILNAKSVNIEYPVLEYPEKVSSLNFDKTPEITGELKGIKGQYLIFDIGVLNIRKFTGYEISLFF